MGKISFLLIIFLSIVFGWATDELWNGILLFAVLVLIQAVIKLLKRDDI